MVFHRFPSLTGMNYSSLNSGMFKNCFSLTSLDLSSWYTSKITDMHMMFCNCLKLTHLDIRNFDFTNVTSYTGMFTSVPSSSNIIVKGDTEKAWTLARNSNFTNVKTVAELTPA